MRKAEELAAFVFSTSYEDLSPDTRLHLKIRILDSLGCALGALQGSPLLALLREHLQNFGGDSLYSVIGGERTAPDRVALYNSAQCPIGTLLIAP